MKIQTETKLCRMCGSPLSYADVSPRDTTAHARCHVGEIITGTWEEESVIESTHIGLDGFLTARLNLANEKIFGNYVLYLTPPYRGYKGQTSVAGHFMTRILEIAEISSWEDLPGRVIRLRICADRIIAIGTASGKKWFNPLEEFDQLKIDIRQRYASDGSEKNE